jgi:sucrose phosphorylase
MRRDDDFREKAAGIRSVGLPSVCERLRNILEDLYDPSTAAAFFPRVQVLIEKWKAANMPGRSWVDERDTILITYGDSITRKGQAPLETLGVFLRSHALGTITSVHILPMYPYSSDDGFSVVDPWAINPELGGWDDIGNLSKDFDLMFDAVVNHLSVSSGQFKGFLADDPRYRDYFIVREEGADYSRAIRPRALPLFTSFSDDRGGKQVWTTFSADQADLNYHNPEVLLDVLDLLCFYASRGARFIRLDAIGFIWKEPGSSCMNLPQAHAIVKLFRLVLDLVAPGLILITETNVPFLENIAYLGDGHDEANIAYQFTLPPLVLHSFLSQDSRPLLGWMESLGESTPSDATTYLNFLSSHDGIGLRPVEGLLSHEEIQNLVTSCVERGGFISYRHSGPGELIPYELNINYIDALAPKDAQDDERAARAIAAHGILLSAIGVPAVYVHTLLGSRNWVEGVVRSGINRRINRERLDIVKLTSEIEDDNSLRHKVFGSLEELILVRRRTPAFHPNAGQLVRHLDKRLVTFERGSGGKAGKVLVIVNISGEVVAVDVGARGRNLLGGVVDAVLGPDVVVNPYEVIWLAL